MKNYGRIYLILADFIIPIPLTILMFYLWVEKTDSNLYAFFIIFLGLVYGYLVPGLLSNVFKLWKFTWPLQRRNVFIHHGFIYTSYFALVFYLSFPEDIQLSLLNIIRITLTNFALFAIITSHNEIIAIKNGMIISFNSKASQGKSAVEVVAYFSFLSFGILGASYALSCILVYDKIVIKNLTNLEDLVIYFIICLCIMILASAPYFIKERKQITKLRKLNLENKI